MQYCVNSKSNKSANDSKEKYVVEMFEKFSSFKIEAC
jgi:hypothetical protein